MRRFHANILHLRIYSVASKITVYVYENLCINITLNFMNIS